jgi:4'-phosphopantetheinyl transferase
MKIAWPSASKSISLPSDALDVWALSLDRPFAPWDELLAMLSRAEHDRASQFRVERPRQRFIATRVALKRLLAKYLDVTTTNVLLEADTAGKPRLAPGLFERDLRFNVAHSGDVALIGVTAGCDIGVDVERLRAVGHAEHIAHRYFHPAEARAILSAPPESRDEAFMRCWTGKEAVLKAVGRGITGSLSSFQAPTEEFHSAWIDLPAAPGENRSGCWLCGLAPGAGYVAAAACLGTARVVRCFAFGG